MLFLVCPSDTMNTLRFWHRGEIVSLNNVTPDRTLLELLREDLGCSAVKEGCGEGDCGACTVVLGEADGEGMRYKAINSCIRLANSVDGLALWTAQDIAPTLATSCASLPPGGTQPCLGRPGAAADPSIASASTATAAPTASTQQAPLHPAQQAMVDCHGSQCGFCTPGFVMSLFGLYQNRVCQGLDVSREVAQQALSGNLCRCTGYRPILDAAQAMAELPLVRVNEAEILPKLKQINKQPKGSQSDVTHKPAYLAPRRLKDLLMARAADTQAQIVAGCTDVGLWVTKQHRRLPRVIDVTRAVELRRVENYRHHIAIGAAVTLTDAFAALTRERPELTNFALRFAGLPVRNSGTLGGNVANGSPIGDSMPLLIALGANVVLMRWDGSQVVHRELALEKLYTGYRQNVMRPDELLAWIKVPRPQAGERLRAYKISKRYDDDISAVCLVLRLRIAHGEVAEASIGAGGVAATPVRAVRTEAALLGQPWSQQTVDQAVATLRTEFQPISDMRASAAYRSEVLGNLLQRYWLESQGLNQINLEDFSLTEAL